MKSIKQAFEQIHEAERVCLDIIIGACPVGSVVTYMHGCHAIDAEVIGIPRDHRHIWVRGVKSGREYTLHPGRIEHVV